MKADVACATGTWTARIRTPLASLWNEATGSISSRPL